MAVRSSKYSTGLSDAWPAQALSSAMSKLPGIHDRRMTRSIAGRELEPIIELPLTGILLTMKRFGRYSATTLLICLMLATTAGWSGTPLADPALADRVVVHKAQHRLYLYNGERLLGTYKIALGLNP